MKFKLNPLTGFFDIVDSSGSGPGTGDVNGPTSSTDNAVVRWDGTTGKLIQNSTAILEDNGVLHVLALMQQDTIPSAVTATVQAGEVYIVGDELNIDGTLDVVGTMILI